MGTKIFAFEDNDESHFDTEKTIEEPTKPIEGETEGKTTDGSVPPSNNPEDTPAKPVEPEIGNLEVDAVYREHHTPEEVIGAIDAPLVEGADEEATRQDAIDDANQATSDLSAIAESLNLAIQKNGYFDSTTADIAMLALESNRRRVGYVNKFKRVSLENFDNNKVGASNIVMEGFKEFFKNIWEMIIKAINKSIEWIKKFFYNLTLGVKNDIDFCRDISNKLLQNRVDNRLELAKKQRFGINKEHYVANGYLSCKLKIDNQPIDDYTREFENVLYLLNPKKKDSSAGSNVFTNTFNDGFIKTLKLIVKEQLIGDATSATENLAFNPLHMFTINNNADLVKGKPATGSMLGITVKPGNLIMHQPVLIGNMYIIHEFNSGYLSGKFFTNFEVLKNIASWRMDHQIVPSTKINDGWLRYMDDVEIKKTTSVVMDILHEVQNFSTVSDALLLFQSKLKEFSSETSKFTFDATNKVAQGKIELVSSIVGAMSAIIRNMNNTTFKYGEYARVQCNAWSLYLQEMYKIESGLVKA